MQFNSVAFLVFFPAVLFAYYILPQKARRYLLLGASYYFYMCWNTKYFVLILFSTLITYVGSLLLGRISDSALSKSTKTRYKSLTIGGVIASSLGVLFVFKYCAAFLAYFGKLLSLLGVVQPSFTLNLLLPVGISFYTFQSISYIIDVYRNDIPVQKSFVNYALFVSFFPQLVARQ